MHATVPTPIASATANGATSRKQPSTSMRRGDDTRCGAGIAAAARRRDRPSIMKRARPRVSRLRGSGPRAVVRRRLAKFKGAEIRRLAVEAVRHIGQRHAAIDGGCAGLETEIEVFRFIEVLNSAKIFSVELRHIDEDVVVQRDAMLVLTR